MRYFLALLLVLIFSAPAQGADTLEENLQRLKALESEMETRQKTAGKLSADRQKITREIAKLRRELLIVDRKNREAENKLETIARRIALLDDQQKRKIEELHQRYGQLGEIIAALAQTNGQASGLILFFPGSSLEAARSAMVLDRVVPWLKARAFDIQGDLQELTLLQEALLEERGKLSRQHTILDRNMVQLAALIAEKGRHEQKLGSARQQTMSQIAAIKREADSLRELVERLQAEQRKRQNDKTPLAPESIRLLLSGQKLHPPAYGRIVQRFKARRNSRLSEDLIIETRQNAVIRAPFDGQILYAQPFGNFGYVIIVQHRGDYASVLHGIGKVLVAEGQWVFAEEPIGQMNAERRLHVQIWHKRRPLDPLKWLEVENNRVIG